ncbi:DNA polymerase III subunit gamma/tau [Candidatus Nanosyncoccus alces]|uniref:DNA polymerase III subunit gamma/tau n=1 Tax=Candidatus Nanosyncoccus alces TaxID=2171997 RepID=A0ABY0FMN2_9BACT|nr:DNA polymerase III subunit gamma/tau [Candidatus Nanosyncoccus alces]RYC74443.1 DNA polymerase III subunit gamma/tau [Candidatus Nanosyncoccus alces]
MKNLYRRYRPVKLEDVVGQPQVTEPLAKSLELKKIGHAYLFIGPRGTGKTSVARIFAHEVNGFNYELEDDYVDIIEIDGASNRGIDNIRELREKAAIAPTSGKYKIYIIDEVHMLTKEAFNALLKTLEEPPAHVIFIMATTDAYKVPVTITSRAQTYTFKLADSKTMFGHLRTIADQEKIKIADEALNIIVKRGGGSFRDSLSLLDQISTLSDQEITKELVISVMGLPEGEKIAELLTEYTTGNIAKIATLLKDLLSNGIKPETLAEEMISTIIAEPKPNLLTLLARLPEVKAPFAEAKLLVALACSPSVTSGAHVPEQSDRKMSSEKDVVTTPSTNKNTTAAPSADFDWNTFTSKVQSMNDAVYSQLVKTSHELLGGVLHIYPERKIVKTILSRDNNKRLLSEAAGGNTKITIHEFGETPSQVPKDDVLDKISGIMGGEVRNDGGGNPFEE